jgi:hypothetical protein
MIAAKEKGPATSPTRIDLDHPSRPTGVMRGLSSVGLANDASCVQMSQKAFANAQAEAALAGFELIALHAGDFLLCRWGPTRACPDLNAVRALIGGFRGRE